ncbi:hypothetical protein [Aliamphritea ceti]|uniref:hypothetical protein n=1 Tax=Aliamphritea ceti TaxID=1524258 RepID=UPI0021C2E6B9|nr:hypothetical protein [Aliamphritea ceti]
MIIRIAVLLLSAFLPVVVLACDNAVETTYAAAGLKVFPEVVAEAIDEKEIARKRNDGEGYYVQLVCDSGEVLMLTKYIGKNMFFRIEYIYETKGLIGKRTTKSNGEVKEYFAK